MRPDFSSRRRSGAPSAREQALLAGALLLVLASGAGAGSAWSQARNARVELERARRSLDEVRARTRSLDETRRSAAAAVRAQLLTSLDAPPSRVLADVAALMPRDVRLDSVALGYGERVELELTVVARGSSAYDLFLERLAESPSFADLTPGPENRDGEVRATVRVTHRGGEVR